VRRLEGGFAIFRRFSFLPFCPYDVFPRRRVRVLATGRCLRLPGRRSWRWRLLSLRSPWGSLLRDPPAEITERAVFSLLGVWVLPWTASELWLLFFPSIPFRPFISAISVPSTEHCTSLDGRRLDQAGASSPRACPPGRGWLLFDSLGAIAVKTPFLFLGLPTSLRPSYLLLTRPPCRLIVFDPRLL